MSGRLGKAMALSAAAHVVAFVGTWAPSPAPRADAEPVAVEIAPRDLGAGAEARAPAPTRTTPAPAQEPRPARARHRRVAADDRASPAVSLARTGHAPAGQAREPSVDAVPSWGGAPAVAGSRWVVLVRPSRLPDTSEGRAVRDVVGRVCRAQGFAPRGDPSPAASVESLLLATPDPLERGAPLFVLRHGLDDEATRTVLERAAAETRHTLAWEVINERPVAVRRPPPADGGTPAHPDRVLILAARGLIVMADPSYRTLLLPPAAPVDAGAAPRPWEELLRMVEHEEAALPDDAIARLEALAVFDTAAWRRASEQDEWALGAAELPASVSLTIGGGAEAPFELRATFASEPAARSWQSHWTRRWRAVQATLGPSAPLPDRAEVTRGGATLRLSSTLAAARVPALLALLVGAPPSQGPSGSLATPPDGPSRSTPDPSGR